MSRYGRTLVIYPGVAMTKSQSMAVGQFILKHVGQQTVREIQGYYKINRYKEVTRRFKPTLAASRILDVIRSVEPAPGEKIRTHRTYMIELWSWSYDWEKCQLIAQILSEALGHEIVAVNKGLSPRKGLGEHFSDYHQREACWDPILKSDGDVSEIKRIRRATTIRNVTRACSIGKANRVDGNDKRKA